MREFYTVLFTLSFATFFGVVAAFASSSVGVALAVAFALTLVGLLIAVCNRERP